MTPSIYRDILEIARTWASKFCRHVSTRVRKKFSVVDGKIRFGLLGVKNVGEGAIDAIIKAREEKGTPSDIFQFINNVEISEVNKKAVESLIKAGALDCLNTNRAAHLAVYEGLVESAQNNAKKNIAGQMSLPDQQRRDEQRRYVGNPAAGEQL